jgi:hypothetical protein
LQTDGNSAEAPKWQPGSGVLYPIPNYTNGWPPEKDLPFFFHWTLVISDLFPQDIVDQFKKTSSIELGASKSKLSLYVLECSDKRVVTVCRIIPTPQDALDYPSVAEWLKESMSESASKPTVKRAIGICLDMYDATDDDNHSDGVPVASKRPRLESPRRPQVIDTTPPAPTTNPPSSSVSDFLPLHDNFTPTPPISPRVFWERGRDHVGEVADRRFKVFEVDLSLDNTFGKIEFPFKTKETGHLTLRRLDQAGRRTTTCESHHYLKDSLDSEGSLENSEVWYRLTDADEIDYLIPLFNFSNTQWPESHQHIIDRVMFTQGLAAALWKEFAGDEINLQNDVCSCASASDR